MIRSLNQVIRDITFERMFESLKYRDFRLLWLGQSAHAAALWIEMVARPWLILEITNGDATMVGLMVATRAAPSLLFGLFAGVMSDRFNRKHLLLAAKSSAFVISLAFVVLPIPPSADPLHHLPAQYHFREHRCNGCPTNVCLWY